ncbi:Fructan 6-exohydrolase [Coccomyxa sp. Obi]|nr:Fructan 6-exohydrolase [Coccomyxa sp. Obi]
MTADKIERTKLGNSWLLDPDKPWYHVMPRSGWLNDPNGPIYYKGKYHIFYQHVVGTSQWDWACSWGHASSADLVHWKHEPIALQPTPGTYDAEGCWSGCSTLDSNDTPVILYTAVRLREKPGLPLPPSASDLGLQMIESQCAAVCRPDDDDLVTWTKQSRPLIELPPPNEGLVGFRDPYIIQRGVDGRPWQLIIGSGVKGKGGTLLLYTSDNLLSGWKYRGSFIKGKSRPCDEWDLGEMWECPFFVCLPQTSAEEQSSKETANGNAREAADSTAHVLCVSPYPHYRKDRPTNPCLCWVGQLSNDTFNVEDASGPHRLDLGDILYAPNAFVDGRGRTLMLAWLQELRTGGAYDYAGCLSLPRLLSLQGGRLHQQPAPELAQLRLGEGVHLANLLVEEGAAAALPQIWGPSVDVSFRLARGSCSAAGILLRAWLRADADSEQPTAAAAVVDWDAGTLEVIFSTQWDRNALSFGWDSVSKRVGGPIQIHEHAVQLRVMVDHSAVEIFTGSGETLTTRVYRGDMAAGDDPGMFFIAKDGAASVTDIAAYTMGSIWEQASDQPAKTHEPAME